MKRVLLAVGLVVFAIGALAQDQGFEFALRNKVLAGKQRPAIILKAAKTLRNVRIDLTRSDGRRLHFRAHLVKAGTVKVFEFRQKPGRYTYRGQFRFQGMQRPFEVSFDCLVAPELKMSVNKAGVDLDAGVIRFRTNRAVVSTRLKIFDKSGELIYEGQPKPRPVGVKERGFVFHVDFPKPDKPVGMAQLQVFDSDGFYAGVQMVPFFVQIPHEEVEFDFGKWVIRKDQEPKLKRTLASIKDALKKLRKDFKVNLYIAGYTDTVGSDADNMKLSANRARAIARWFVRHGVKIPVFYQGFGERVLRVATPDNTPEPRNRRAVYVLAVQAPGPDRMFPTTNWRLVR